MGEYDTVVKLFLQDIVYNVNLVEMDTTLGSKNLMTSIAILNGKKRPLWKKNVYFGKY